MRLPSYIKAKTIILSVLILASFFTIVPQASLNTTNNKNAFLPHNNTQKVAKNLLIKQRNPVVNEGNLITLIATDISGNNVSGTVWSSGSPDIAQVNPDTGEVTGVKQGFATITASRNGENVSTFVVVTKVRKGKGERVPGDSKIDNGGRLYISDPLQNVILVADKNLDAAVKLFAGQRNIGGNQNGFRQQARFAGPTAIAIDNSPRGGLYITDTLNHQIRKIDFNGQVETLLGQGFPGRSLFGSDGMLSSDNISFNSPRGIVADAGGNIYIADTDNHAIYYVDFARDTVSLLAGQPGSSGQDDGMGKEAKFKRPAGLALSSDGRLLTVADQDNNRIRLIDINKQVDGKLVATVSTLGTNISNQGLSSKSSQGTGLIFDKPQSLSLDSLNNLYVVDDSGVQIVLGATSANPQVVQLAQPGVSFNKAVNVTVRGSEVFVLDAKAASEEEAISVVTVGAPEIKTVTPSVFRLEGGADVVVTGSNFAPETMVTFGDTLISPQVVSATELRFKVLPQTTPGIRTFSLLTRGGIAQRELNIIAKPASELAFEEITTIAGGLSFSGDGGSALEANLGISTRVALDNLGNVFVADVIAGKVRRVNVDTGIINTIVGGGISLNDGVIANVAKIEPNSIAIDSDGNIFISDSLTESIRRVDSSTSIITTIAGGKGRAFGGDGGAATSAGFGDVPHSLAFDRNGNLFVSTNNRVRRIDAKTSVISTVVGNGNQGFSGDGEQASKASLALPSGLAFDSKGNLFIADAFNGRVRRVDAQTNIITTVAGNGGFAGGSDRDGKPATSISLVGPSAVAIDSQDNLIVSDFLVSRVDLSTGIINIVKQNPPVFKCNNTEIFDLLLTTPGTTMALDGGGNLFVSDLRRVRKLSLSTGAVSTVAGRKLIAVRGDKDLATNASLGASVDATTDPQGNIYLADFDSNVIRRIDATTGIIDRFAGVGKNDCDFVGVPNGDGGPALNANFLSLTAITSDSRGNLYVADFSEGKVRRIDVSTKIITTFAGNGSLEDEVTGDGGPATKAGLGGVRDLAFDTQGNLIIASQDYVRRVDIRTNIITTIAGNGGKNFGKDGDKATSIAVAPVNITVDNKNNIFIGERGIIMDSTITGGIVRRVDASTGTISTVAGNRKTFFSNDGVLATNAGLGNVRSVEVDLAGNLFISAAEFDPENFVGFPNVKIFKVDANTKTINTFINGRQTYQGDGGSVTNAGFVGVPILSFAPSGDLMFLDLNIPSVAALRLVHLPKGSGGPATSTISISNAAYVKPNLSIDGQGFGASATKVTINGTDASTFVSSTADNKVVLTSSRKKLNIRKGINQITVTNSGGATASFQFSF